MSDHVIFHIDVNSAFLSWSALKALEEGSTVDLRTIPSIVGGDQETRHGIVTAKSIPAKAYGIQTAETIASAKSKCPGLVVVPSDFAYYREKSRAMMDHLRAICPVIEQASIDECYMDFEPIRSHYESPEAAAHAIKDGVYSTFGFTVNVGISDRKVLAKMASDFKKPNLVHTLYHSEIEEKMWPLDIGDLFMCGKSAAEFFRRMGIRTIGDLAQTDPSVVESWMKSHGKLLWEFANGIDDSVVETERGPVKGVGNSTTFSHDLTTVEEAERELAILVDSVTGRLRKKGFLAGQVTVEIKYATFRRVTHQRILLSPTAESEDILPEVNSLFEECWDGEPIRLLGVRSGKLTEVGEPVQMDLFSYQRDLEKEQAIEKERLERERKIAEEKAAAERARLEQESKLAAEKALKAEKQRKLSEAMAKINGRYGAGAVLKGSDYERRKE